MTIPANIKSLITNCVINRLMSMLFSFQSRSLINAYIKESRRETKLFDRVAPLKVYPFRYNFRFKGKSINMDKVGKCRHIGVAT